MSRDHAEPHGPDPAWPRAVGGAVLGVLVVATATNIVAYDAMRPTGRIVTALVAFAAFGALFVPAVRARALTRGRVVTAAGLLVVIAVLAPPAGSHDLWSYAMYGRLIAVHHVSPFTHVPADFPHDPLVHLVAPRWRHTSSVYGPGFVALSAAGTAVTGASVLATRLLFQLLEALALGGVLMIIWRRTRDPVAVAFVGLNPALLLVVNGAHNDLVVGLALLAGTLLLEDRRPRRAGLVLAGGALVKLVLVLPLGALLLWTWRRHRTRDAWKAGATAGIVLLAGYLVSGGGAALGPLADASKQHSRSSLWQIATQWLADPLGIHRPDLFRVEGDAALLLVAVLVLVIVLRTPPRGAARWRAASATGPLVAGSAALGVPARGRVHPSVVQHVGAPRPRAGLVFARCRRAGHGPGGLHRRRLRRAAPHRRRVHRVRRRGPAPRAPARAGLPRVVRVARPARPPGGRGHAVRTRTDHDRPREHRAQVSPEARTPGAPGQRRTSSQGRCWASG